MNRRVFGRRVVLMAGMSAAALSVAGCVPATRGRFVASHTLDSALASAERMYAGYAAAIEAGSGGTATLEMVRDNHTAHIEALRRILGRDEPESVETPDASLDALIEAEKEAAEIAADACVGAAPQYAVLLGEIAASRNCHVAVLREIHKG
ncbi:hypothetical protein STSO111631_20640 [Stackebrandtia soli]